MPENIIPPEKFWTIYNLKSVEISGSEISLAV
jgi:hypothetical protein